MKTQQKKNPSSRPRKSAGKKHFSIVFNCWNGKQKGSQSKCRNLEIIEAGNDLIDAVEEAIADLVNDSGAICPNLKNLEYEVVYARKLTAAEYKDIVKNAK